uniref:Tau tubulin kinase 1b n=1 Tax=Salarias fasciatus TaxID=181472 RepID=A0A672GCX9_SALFA
MDILGSPSRHVYSSQPAQMLSVDPGCRGDGQVSGRQEASVASADQEAHSNAFIRSVPLAEEEDFDSKEWVIIDKEAELRDFLPTTSGTTDEEPEELRPLEEQEERRRLRGAGGDLVVRPKTHTRDSSRGMLTLTEEEASRRSGGSPAQSPCHSLPSGRPRRRESEPTGPHRPASSPVDPSGPSLPSPDYRTKAQSEEKELFHILPQLQAKRADFLSVMLTGTLPQRRGLAPPEEPVPEPPGPGDDDVTKSQSNSDASQKSTEHSQDAAPSTLMAEDHRGQREHASAADADPDLEDASKTLVLFSPGDTRKSPSGAEVALEAELATPTALASHADRLAVGDGVQPEVSDTGRLSPALRFDLRPSTPIAPASPPFTKVERTFIHIAETSHLNIMSSNGHSARDGEREVFVLDSAPAPAWEVKKQSPEEPGLQQGTAAVEDRPKEKGLLQGTAAVEDRPKEKGLLQGTAAVEDRPKEKGLQQGTAAVEDRPKEKGLQQGTAAVEDRPKEKGPLQGTAAVEDRPKEKGPLQGTAAVEDRPTTEDVSVAVPELVPDAPPQALSTEEAATLPMAQLEPQPVVKPRIRSRIPILMSEEDSGSEQSSSLSARARLQQRARQLDLARLLVQKQQGRWMRRRMLSGTSSSLSSGDDERRRASETLSTAGSEEDTHTSDEPKRCSRLKTTEESKEGRSKIPRPVTPVRRSPRGLTAAAAAAASSLCVPDMSSTKASFSRSNRVELSTPSPHWKGKPVPPRSSSSSSGAPAPCGSPRMPLRVLFGTRRSLSSTHCRTDSPSPQRAVPAAKSRQLLSVRAPTVPVLPPRTGGGGMRRSASQEATAPARTRPKAAGSARERAPPRERAGPAR